MRSEKYRVTKSDPRHAALSQTPPGDARRQATATPARITQDGVRIEHLVGQSQGNTDSTRDGVPSRAA
jgi:hypothetical protein